MLITEAALDDEVNKQLEKIQLSVIRLEQLVEKFSKEKIRPIPSQIAAVLTCGRDLSKVAAELQAL